MYLFYRPFSQKKTAPEIRGAASLTGRNDPTSKREDKDQLQGSIERLRLYCLIERYFLQVRAGIMSDSIFLGGGGDAYADPQVMLMKYANRHGLITGATGTGKTVTLQILAEGFSAAGVPVFLSDVKGDLSGLAASGREDFKLHKPFMDRAETIGLDLQYTPFQLHSGIYLANRATRSAQQWLKWGLCCWHVCWSCQRPKRGC